MNRLIKQVFLVCVCLFAFIGSAMADQLADAESAYHAGDYAKAVKLYRLLAEQGDVYAQYGLGLLYIKGHGVPQNYVLAHMWSNIAAANFPEIKGTNWANDLRDSIEPLMTAQQIAEAQEQARKCTANEFKGC